MREWRSRYEIYVNHRCMMKWKSIGLRATRLAAFVAVKGDEVVSITARHKFIGMEPPIWRET